MSLDPYSLCPGGSGKKIKFCCSDLVTDLQKIERMVDGDQHAACLQHIESLQKTHPDRACLFAAKTLLLRLEGHAEEGAATAAAFLEKHPENPIALAESALVAAMAQDSETAMEALGRAIVAGDDQIHGRVYEAIGAVARALTVDGHLIAARMLCLVQLSVRREDNRAMQLLTQLNSASHVPLLMKDDRTLQPCSDDAPYQAAFDEALKLADHARWAQAAERFDALAEQAGDDPVYWQNVALLRCWLADPSAAIDALRKFAALDVPQDDAVEAEALAMLLSDDPLGDQLDVVSLAYPVEDADRLVELFSAERRLGQIPVEPTGAEEGPPPQAVYYVFDRPLIDSDEAADRDAIPRVVSQAALYGRQTDRPARLELLGVTSAEVAPIREFLEAAAGDQFQGEPKVEVMGQLSATRELLTRTWRMPVGRAQESVRELIATFLEEALLDEWPTRPLGILDGKTPAEAAADGDTSRTKLLAAVLIVQSWVEESDARFDCNRLRGKLGLDESGPVDPGQIPIKQVPLVRLDRVEVGKLSDDDLALAYRRSMAFGARRAVSIFARALVDRPSMAAHEERLRAYQILARMAEDSDEALALADEGRKAAEAQGQSSAPWDLMELSLRFESRDGPGVSRLIEHLQTEHVNEPGVAEALTQLLVEVGLIHPDGTPAAAPPMQPEPAEDESGKLWTPDSERPAGDKGKLWTPGMD